MEIIEFMSEEGEKAMARDKTLFERIKQFRSEPILRFYRWQRPTISYGRTQKIEESLLFEWEQQGMDAVRRPTGGGIVYHGNDTCFSLLWKKEDTEIPWGIRHSYCAIHKWIQYSLKELGIESQSYTPTEKNRTRGWCFQNPVQHDLISQGEKIVGGAQWRDGDAVLHQGSIQRSLSQTDLFHFQESFQSLFGLKINVFAAAD